MTAPTDRPTGARRAALTAATLAATLLVTVTLTALARSTPQTRTTTTFQRPPATGAAVPDLCGTVPCQETDADPGAVRAVATALPTASIVARYSLSDGTGRRFQFIAAETRDGIQFVVQARCGDGALPRTTGAMSPGQRGPIIVSGVAVTGSGCTVAVVVQVPAGIAVPRAALTALLADGRLAIG